MSMFGKVLTTGEDIHQGDFVKVVMTTTQLLSALNIFKPLINWGLEAVVKSLSKAKKTRILKRMESYRGRNCKLRTLAYTVSDSIIDVIQNKPGGYLFWHSLPKRGTHNADAVRKKIADTLLESLYDSTFMEMLIKAALDENGKPLSHTQLYRWLLTQVYSDNAAKLYSDWLKVNKNTKSL